MPELVTFRGRPVKRRRRVAGGMRLIFINPVRGEPGEVTVVSHFEWLRYGQIQYFAKNLMPNVRALAREFEL